MSKENNNIITLDSIIQAIHDEVERKRKDFSIEVSNYDKSDDTLNLDRFQDENNFQYKQNYVLNDFLRYHNEDFINFAYRAILGREPDTNGFNHYNELYKSGKIEKVTILGRLLFSKEGKNRNIKIKGILIPYVLSEVYNIKFIGYFIRLIFAIINLPLIIKNLSNLERHIFFEIDNIKNKHNNSLDVIERNILTILHDKADKSELEQKADKSELEQKADKSELEQKADRRELELKADKKEFNLYLKTVDYARDYLRLINKEILYLIEEAKKRLPQDLTKEEIKTISEKESYYYDALYASFEESFRGNRELIKERLEVYIDRIEKLSEDKESLIILDIGCGRGEWIELLKDKGYHAKGVDINKIFVEYCKSKELDVVYADAIEYLHSLSDNSFSVITCFHLVEHLELRYMIELFDEIKRVLKKGGIIIAETPNPENIIVGSCNFYLDPTHRNPIPPETLKFLVKHSGFVDVDILRLNDAKIVPPASDIEEIRHIAYRFNMSQDYAVIGYKN